MATNPEFDQFAEQYEESLGPGLRWTGEGKDYFAQRRIEWLAQKLAPGAGAPQLVLDFGCGTGTATPYLLDILRAGQVIGVDVSARSLEVARSTYAQRSAQFLLPEAYRPQGQADLAFCNGVFHHIPRAERADAVDYVLRALRPGGLFALWENNPWNPAMRAMMRLAPVDRNAIMLSPPETRRLLAAGGFEVLETNFLFLFPKLLGWLRPLEPRAARLPLGAQYLTLGRKPAR
jgi:SAM-dependent methyltransferase